MIMDERKANAFLENVSYFRFAAYLRPFKASDRHSFKENATFEKAVRLYVKYGKEDFHQLGN